MTRDIPDKIKKAVIISAAIEIYTVGDTKQMLDEFANDELRTYAGMVLTVEEIAKILNDNTNMCNWLSAHVYPSLSSKLQFMMENHGWVIV